MNVQAELPDHPKYLRLRKAVGERAMEYLVRLWGHCQNNQRGEFWPGANAEYVELICRWDGASGLLFAALAEPFNGREGWLALEPEGVRIHDWQAQNLRLKAAWNNGASGGRKPTTPPRDPARLPTENPRVTRPGSGGATNEVDGSYEVKGVPGPVSATLEAVSGDESQIPTEAEVIAYGQGAPGIPADYCLDFHQWRTNNRMWLNSRQELILWQKDLLERWTKNRATWKPKKTSAAASGDLEARLQTERDPEKRRALRHQLKNLA